jgi:hypothetical protein
VRGLPGDVRFPHSDEIVRRILDGIIGLLASKEVRLAVVVLVLVQATMPEVDMRKAQIQNEVANYQRCDESGGQRDSDVGASHGGQE